MSDLVRHPAHYQKEDRMECWDEQEIAYGTFAVVCFDILNAHKYMYRAGEKKGNPKEQDIAKINNYISHANKLIKRLGFFRKRKAKKMMNKLKEYLDKEGIDYGRKE